LSPGNNQRKILNQKAQKFRKDLLREMSIFHTIFYLTL